MKVRVLAKTHILVLIFFLFNSGTSCVFAACKALEPNTWGDCAEDIVHQGTHVSVAFHNQTNRQYLVVMDNDRESYLIAAGGSATFRNARIGDNPTLHIRDQRTKEEYDSWTIGILSGDMDLDYSNYFPESVTPAVMSNLSGKWRDENGTIITLIQQGSDRFSVTYPNRGPFDGRFSTDSSISVNFYDNGNCCTGAVINGNSQINWSNGTKWLRAGN